MGAWLDRHLPDGARPRVAGRSRAADGARAEAQVQDGRRRSRPARRWRRCSPRPGWPDAREPVLIVGHQPTLGAVAAFLLSGEEAYWAVKKGAVWWLTNRDRGGASAIVLRVVIGPDFV